MKTFDSLFTVTNGPGFGSPFTGTWINLAFRVIASKNRLGRSLLNVDKFVRGNTTSFGLGVNSPLSLASKLSIQEPARVKLSLKRTNGDLLTRLGIHYNSDLKA